MRRNTFYAGELDPVEGRLVPSGLAARVPAEIMALPAQSGGAVRVLGGLSSGRETGRFEIHWMRGMVSHHGMAIQMARLALRNSSNPEVLALARGIARAQTREIAQLRGWLAGWYGVEGVRPRTTADDRQMLRDLASQTGEAFDRSFLGMMIEHHTSAVGDAGDCLENAAHPRLRELCTNIETTQTAEIAQMRALLGESGDMTQGGHGGHAG